MAYGVFERLPPVLRGDLTYDQNGCRSQRVEALGRYLAGDIFETILFLICSNGHKVKKSAQGIKPNGSWHLPGKDWSGR